MNTTYINSTKETSSNVIYIYKTLLDLMSTYKEDGKKIKNILSTYSDILEMREREFGGWGVGAYFNTDLIV